MFFRRLRDSRAEMRFCSRRSRRLRDLVASSSLSESCVPSLFSSSLDIMAGFSSLDVMVYYLMPCYLQHKSTQLIFATT